MVPREVKVSETIQLSKLQTGPGRYYPIRNGIRKISNQLRFANILETEHSSYSDWSVFLILH